MSYICIKKLSLGGVDYLPGDIIPDAAFVGGRAKKLKAFGYITEAGGDVAGLAATLIECNEAFGYITEAGGDVAGLAATLIECNEKEDPVISVIFAEGDECAACPVNTEQLQSIADTMQKNASDAAASIEKISDESILMFIAKVDSRKTVKDAAQKRLTVLYTLPSPLPDSSESTPSQNDVTGDPEQSIPSAR